MTAALIVTRDKKQIAKVPLAGSLFIIGRSDKCEVPIDETLASRQHAEITAKGERYMIRDLGSTNGTLVNGEKLTYSRELRDGDQIEIGSTRVQFHCEGAEARDDDETRAASPGNLNKKELGQAVVKKKDKGNVEVRLRVADGPLAGGVFKNWDGPLTIGRSLVNHVVLVDDAVSSCHAKIVQEGEHYFIVDTDSANGTFLNGVKAQREELTGGCKIKVGASTLVFDLTDLRVQRRNINIALVSVIVCAVVIVAIKLWPDPAGAHIQSALRQEADGNFSNALQEFKTALTLAPNRTEATEGYGRVNNKINADVTVMSAKAAAEEEDYDKALVLVDRAQRMFTSTSATELKLIIDSIKRAKVALDHQNWDGAVKLLQNAQENYPTSKLIAEQLAQAQKELTAEENLVQAKGAFQFEQWDKAHQLLVMIPTNSFYADQAKDYLDKITHQEKTAAAVNNAKSLYNQGQLLQALDEIERGLKISPDSPVLADLQKRVRSAVRLADPLKKAAKLGQGDAIDDLLAARHACTDVLQAESDPLNQMVKSAKEIDARITQWLQTLSRSFTDRAQELLKSDSRKEALESYDQAVKADPSNQIAVQGGSKLRNEITKHCEDLFGNAKGYQELGQIEKARENLNRVLQLDLPDDKWYKLASEKLSQLK
jgi:pSer/pThr/pTyr-binding forkhead associated (FHA) protein/tetratricopeptide (TPR) repeat protein